MATLNVTIKEELELYGEPHGGSIVKTIGSITKSYKSIVPVGLYSAGVNTLYSVSISGLGGSVEASSKTKYLRVTNLGAIDVKLVVKTSGGDSHIIKVASNDSFVMFNDSCFAETGFTNTSLSLDTLGSIEAYTSSSTSVVEVFAASID